MGIQDWSDEIVVVEAYDDPQFTDDFEALVEKLESTPSDVVLNFSAVSFINSSNVAHLLRLRKTMLAIDRKLILCDVSSNVWGVFVVTGLDKIFEFTNDIATALATLQLAGGPAEA